MFDDWVFASRVVNLMRGEFRRQGVSEAVNVSPRAAGERSLPSLADTEASWLKHTLKWYQPVEQERPVVSMVGTELAPNIEGAWAAALLGSQEVITQQGFVQDQNNTPAIRAYNGGAHHQKPGQQA